MEKEKLDIEALRQKREMLRKQKKKRIIIAAAVCILLIGVIVLSCLLSGLDKGTVNLEQIKQGTTKVIDKDTERRSVLNVYADDMTGSFNPVNAVNYGDQVVANIVFEPLMRRDAEGRLEEHLIRSLNVSEDGLTYTIKLKNNILFSDGTKMTARDVLASIAVMAASENDGTAAVVYGRIKGMSGFSGSQKEFPEGLTATAEDEIQIVFEEASPDNLLVMETMIQKGTFSEEATDKEVVTEILDRIQNGIGTGAYCFTETSNGSLCTLTANENFREKIQDIKTVEFRAISYYDISTLTEEGVLDVAVYSGNSELYDILYGWDGFSVYSKPKETVYALYFNQDNPALENVKVRQAIAYAFDRERNGLEELSRSLAFDEGIALSTEAAKASGIYKYDKGKAKSLLRDAEKEVSSIKDGLTLSLPILEDNAMHKQLAEALKSDLKEIGITLEVTELSQHDYIQTIYLRMDFDLYLTGITATDGIASMKEFYAPTGSLPINIEDKGINAAYEGLAKSYSIKQVEENEAKLYEAIQEAAPIMVIGRSRNFISVSADLSGFEAIPHQLMLSELYKIQVKK